MRRFMWTILVGGCILGATEADGGELRPGVYRTPEERFERLADYPFSPHYFDFQELRMHYVDEGPREAPVVVLLHGEPSWSYLYRKMIPPLVAAGHRVVAPDLIGFGKSDKPARREDHSYPFHVAAIHALLQDLELENITLFCQDWGGLIGLRIVAEEPGRFARVIAANTGLPAGPGEDGILVGTQFTEPDADAEASVGLGGGFMAWLRFSQTVVDFDSGAIVQGGSERELTAEEVDAYRAPFPDERYKAGARALPTLVASQQASNRRAWEALESFDKPFLTLFSDRDAVTGGGEKALQERIPGAAGRPHATIEGGGHFLQEDAPDELVRRILGFVASGS